eukprot:g5504.t1
MSFFSSRSSRRSTKSKSDDSEKGKEAELATEFQNVESPKLNSDSRLGLALGNLVPDFTAFSAFSASTEGKIEWHRWIGENWVLLFSQPGSFTPVDTTELAFLTKLTPEFEKREIKIAVVSTNTVEEHKEWIRDFESSEIAEGITVSFPLISDPNQSIVESYGMQDLNDKAEESNPVTSRAVVLIGPDKRLKMSMLYPFSTGRNMHEILRIIDSIKLHVDHGVLTPANWIPGDKCVVIPELEDVEVKEKHGKITTIAMPSGKNYMRLVDDPTGLATSNCSRGGSIWPVLTISTGVVIGILMGKYIKPLREKLT